MDSKSAGRASFWAGTTLGIFLTASVFFLWTEHSAHFYGAIPYLLVFLCIVVLFLFLRSPQSSSKNTSISEKSGNLSNKQGG